MDISNIDKNFMIEKTLDEADMNFYDVKEEPFRLYGFYDPKNESRFLRMSQEAAKAVSPAVESLNDNTAGGRVRFATNSPYVAIRVNVSPYGAMPHMTLCGSVGFDLYEDKGVSSHYVGTFFPTYEAASEGKYEQILYLPDDGYRNFTINFPLYHNVESLHIGIKKGSSLQGGLEYACEKPVVYYGSSITQGGCASRPGNTYQSILSRRLNADYINLGMSGNGMGETAMAEYIASLSMSAFVMDYDHNAPTVEHLERTHRQFFDIVRGAQKDLPIIFISRPNFRADHIEDVLCRTIIHDTFVNAIKNGDKHVYFIDGAQFFAFDGGDGCTVDGIHPNDLGFMQMANGIEPVLRQAIN